MASSAPSTPEVEDLRKALAEERKRVDHLMIRINEVLQHCKQNDDRLEGLVQALAGRIESAAGFARA